MAAFEIERLGKVRNFAFTVYDVLGLVLRDYRGGEEAVGQDPEVPAREPRRVLRREKLARNVTAEDVENYVLLRRTQQRPGSKEPTAEATIRVELAALKRGFNLAARLRRGLTLDNIPRSP